LAWWLRVVGVAVPGQLPARGLVQVQVQEQRPALRPASVQGPAQQQQMPQGR